MLGMKSRRRAAATGALAMLRRHRLLRRALKAAQPELVVSFLTRTNILSVLAAWPLRIPVIVSERNNPALQTVGPVWSRLRRMTYPRDRKSTRLNSSH